MSALPIDIRTAPLAGTVLVEASAGTGKTWTIAALYVRLLLEHRLLAEQVLVLTFGVTATAELKSRIRERLVQVRDALLPGDLERLAGEDDALLAHVGRRSTDPSRDALWLALAVENFDQAPVFTLHGFCQRALAEYAFESGAPFVAELAPDESALVDEVAQDFWRCETAAASPLWGRWLAARAVTPARLARDIVQFVQRAYAEVIGPPSPDEMAFDAYHAAFAAAQRLWHASRDDLQATLGPVMRKDWLLSRSAKLDALFADGPVLPPVTAVLRFFTPGGLAAKVKGTAVPNHAFLEAAAMLVAASEEAARLLLAKHAEMRVRLARYARDELARRKRERALVGYNDLVMGLRDALRSPGGEALAATLRERYPAALLDEFQDTDPMQAEIFQRVYAGSGLPVYCVGDPKQAIYGFRGADVHAYLAARDAADAQRTLLVNQRSIPAQVAAVNAVFSRARAFRSDEIGFAPSLPGPRAHAPLAITDDLPAPFTLWFMSAVANAPLTKEAANECAARATADAISRLLAPGAAMLGKCALEGRHVAVLVSTHVQGRLVRRRLAERGVASVTYGQDSVYCTPEAVAIERLLLAVAEPGREGLLRGALATDLLGADAEALARLEADTLEWDSVQARFVAYRDRALAHGFIRMWRELVEAEGMPGRLLALPDGERRLTNLQHLSDLLQQASADDGLDLDALARLLARARETRGTRGMEGDAQLLRLESDERLVRVLTVHTAKGLEFPIVFCPFLWDGRVVAGEGGIAACHERGGRGRAVIDVGSEHFDLRRARAVDEERAERVRVAYVALTRAKYRCVVAWGRVNEAENSALAWLLHGARNDDFAARTDASLRDEVEALAGSSDGAIAVVDLPASGASAVARVGAAASDALQAREFTGAIPAPWRVSSYSGLLARRALELPDHDALPALPLDEPSGAPAESAAESIFGFPRGVGPGTLVHAVFERIDFARPDGEAARAIVDRMLAEHGVDAVWAPVLRRMLSDVTATPLDASSGLSLQQIAADQRIAEMEFLFPVDAGVPQLVPGAAPPRGFMKGFIDLVFTFGGRWYLLDWKSNWLGDRVQDYATTRLAHVMRESLYHLQYRLYTVALHRHLRSRLPGYDYETHFGGAFYLFVRGMRPANGPATGVFFARPGRDEIETLSRQLSAPKEAR